jgi:methyl-accepting chemotaxis protein
MNRISVNVLLKSVISALALGVVVLLGIGVWSSWNRLTAVTRIHAVAETSGYLFTALHNLRVDRATTVRELSSDQPVTGANSMLGQVRGADMPALKAGLASLQEIDFPERQQATSRLGQAISKLEALHKESNTAFTQPKAQRRSNLPQEYSKEVTDLMALIDLVSSQLNRAVKLEDALTDQLLEIKQLAWIARNAAGDASVMISNSMAGLPLPAEPMTLYKTNIAKLETAWSALEDMASGLPLPPRMSSAIQHGRNEYLGKDFTELRMKMLNALINKEKIEVNAQDWTRSSVAKLASLLNVAEVALDVTKENAAANRASAQRLMFIEGGFLVLAILLAGGMMVMVSSRVIAPLKTIQHAMLKVASGDFSVNVKAVDRKDEVGQIVNAVSSMVSKVRETISDIKSSASEVTNASVEISSATTDLSQRTEEQAASLEETSAAMEQISATVKKNAENAQQANQSAAQTRQVADRGGDVVSKAVGAMAKIEESSRKISDIIGVIDEIARQTNLLALNAAVEAARAGEAGRGFAVVASEVRSLAQRSSQAAKDIKDLITNSNSQVKDGVDLVNQAGAALNEIVESIKSVATIVADIANASGEQATGLEQINKALNQMDEVTQQNSALVEENAATAKTLETQAKVMDEKMAFFQIGDGAVSMEVHEVQKPRAKHSAVERRSAA